MEHGYALFGIDFQQWSHTYNAVVEKYHVDIGNELIAEYDKLAPVEKGRWLQEQGAKRKAISKVTCNFLGLKLRLIYDVLLTSTPKPARFSFKHC
jgi:hypothetical protein